MLRLPLQAWLDWLGRSCLTVLDPDLAREVVTIADADMTLIHMIAAVRLQDAERNVIVIEETRASLTTLERVLQPLVLERPSMKLIVNMGT